MGINTEETIKRALLRGRALLLSAHDRRRACDCWWPVTLPAGAEHVTRLLCPARSITEQVYVTLSPWLSSVVARSGCRSAGRLRRSSEIRKPLIEASVIAPLSPAALYSRCNAAIMAFALRLVIGWPRSARAMHCGDTPAWRDSSAWDHENLSK